MHLKDTISEIRFGSRRYVLDLLDTFSIFRSYLKTPFYFFSHIWHKCHLLIYVSDYRELYVYVTLISRDMMINLGDTFWISEIRFGSRRYVLDLGDMIFSLKLIRRLGFYTDLFDI